MRGKRAEEDDEFELDSGCCGADPITKQVRTKTSLSVTFLNPTQKQKSFICFNGNENGSNKVGCEARIH